MTCRVDYDRYERFDGESFRRLLRHSAIERRQDEGEPIEFHGYSLDCVESVEIDSLFVNYVIVGPYEIVEIAENDVSFETRINYWDRNIT